MLRPLGKQVRAFKPTSIIYILKLIHRFLIVIQLAGYSGFSPIITTASLKDSDSFRDLGAAHIFDRSIPEPVLAREISKIVNGKPVNYVYDTISDQSTHQTAVALLNEGGHLALLLPAAVEIPSNTVVIQVYGGHKAGTAGLLSRLYHDNLCTLLEQGIINKVRLVRVKFDGTKLCTDGLSAQSG